MYIKIKEQNNKWTIVEEFIVTTNRRKKWFTSLLGQTENTHDEMTELILVYVWQITNKSLLQRKITLNSHIYVNETPAGLEWNFSLFASKTIQ